MTGFVGILALDTAFERIPGDAGHPVSYGMPARIHVVAGADAARIVSDTPPPEDIAARFETAARELEAGGADVIVSTCGFLIHLQARVASAVAVPVMLSALTLAPMIGVATGRPVGVLTASAAALGPRALRAAGIDAAQVRIAGMQDAALFRETFTATRVLQRRTFDRGAMEEAAVARAARLVSDAPEIGAIVLECGNLPPYADAIRARTGRPVFHLPGAARLLAAG